MESDVPKVSGVIGAFESRRVQPAITRRVAGFWRFAWIVLLMLFVFSVSFAVSVTEHVDSRVNGAKGAALVGCIVVGLLCILGLYRLIQNRIERRWYARGVPRDIAISLSVEGDGLHISSDFNHLVVFWTGFSEVSLEDSYWVLINAAYAHYIPRRLFASPAAERVFFSTVLNYLTPQARARSERAAKLLVTLK
jgi:hypothetical protein